MKKECLDCEFYEAFHDRANHGGCFLDYFGDHGIKTVKSTDNCEFWMGSTVEDD